MAVECDAALQLRDLPPAGLSAAFSVGFSTLVLHGCRFFEGGCRGLGSSSGRFNRVLGFGVGVRSFFFLKVYGIGFRG